MMIRIYVKGGHSGRNNGVNIDPTRGTHREHFGNKEALGTMHFK